MEMPASTGASASEVSVPVASVPSQFPVTRVLSESITEISSRAPEMMFRPLPERSSTPILLLSPLRTSTPRSVFASAADPSAVSPM